jgi:hypothetical protein
VRLYSQFDFSAPITILEPDTTTERPLPCGGSSVGMSGDGRRLFVSCPATANLPRHVLATDAATGTVVGVVPVGPSLTPESDFTGTYLFSPGVSQSGLLSLRKYHVETGQLIAELDVGGSSVGQLTFEPRTSRLWAEVHDLSTRPPSGVYVYDANSLARVVRLPAPFDFANAVVVPDPDRDLAFVHWTGVVPGGGYRNYIIVYETVGFSPIAQAELPDYTRALGMVMGPRPPRALDLSAAVAGNTVTLEWTNETRLGLATGLIVEAGSGPGLTNLARLPVAAGQTTLVVTDVPAGTYHVRVRPANGTGIGEPSNEIVVTVR